jgi:hypothetical protein
VHGVNLSKVTLQRPARLHANSREGIGLALRNLADCGEEVSNSFQFIVINSPSIEVRKFSDLRFGRTISESPWENRTRGVGQLILAAPDLVLQTLSFAPSRSDLGLHLFARHIGCHFAGQ